MDKRKKIRKLDRKFLIKFAIKNLFLHKMRTLLTLIGIIIGIAAIIFLVSFGYGLEKLVATEVAGGPNTYIIDVGQGKSKGILLNDDLINQIKNMAHVERAEVIISAAATINNNGEESGTALFGTTPGFMGLGGYNLRQGELFSYDSTESVVKDATVNSSFVDLLGKSDQELIGSEVEMSVILPKELADGEEKIAPEQKYEIGGVITDENGPAIYTDYRNLVLLGSSAYSQVKVKVESKDYVQGVKSQIEDLGLKTDYIGDTLVQIEQIFNVFKTILASFGLIAFLIAALGMFNVLTISLLERVKEVALLKILGMKKREINSVFMTESMLLGIFGGIWGIIIGLIVVKIANVAIRRLALAQGGESTSVFWTPMLFIVLMFVFSSAVSFITGWYPARRATKVSPLDVLRYE